ncbi:hypothetical protein ACFQX6_24470 [Streptosporangium lutulentum]
MKKIIALVCVALFAGTAAATAPAVPKGFLLYEKDAAKKDKDPETNWKISNSPKTPLEVNPCRKTAPGGAGRTVARTVRFIGVPDFMKVEQVILYNSPAAARKAVAQLRAALSACRSTTGSGSGYRYVSAPVTGLGDEALRVSGQVYYGKAVGVGGERSVLVRKGDAVLVYVRAGSTSSPPRVTGPTNCVTPER